MGSSSSFAVGLIKALTALRGQLISKQDLARKPIELEQAVLKEHVGSQDQVATAYGGFNVIRFSPARDISVEPVTVPAARLLELRSRLLLFYTGTSRLASAVASQVVANLQHKQADLRQMRAMVDQSLSIISDHGSLDDFGRLLHEGWMLKRDLSTRVSNPLIDSIYEMALRNGALGGKLLGAGSTGFMVFYVPPDQQPRVIQALSGYLHVPFKFEDQGSTLVYYGPNDSAAFVRPG